MISHEPHDSRAGIPAVVDTRSDPDRDILFRWIYIVGAVLVVVTVLYAVLMWPLSVGMVGRLESADEPASPIVEANRRALPPAPRLQPDPPREIEALRAWERQRLEEYGWVDRQAGLARIPVERAKELLLEQGLPKVPNPNLAAE